MTCNATRFFFFFLTRKMGACSAVSVAKMPLGEFIRGMIMALCTQLVATDIYPPFKKLPGYALLFIARGRLYMKEPRAGSSKNFFYSPFFLAKFINDYTFASLGFFFFLCREALRPVANILVSVSNRNLWLGREGHFNVLVVPILYMPLRENLFCFNFFTHFLWNSLFRFCSLWSSVYVKVEW